MLNPITRIQWTTAFDVFRSWIPKDPIAGVSELEMLTLTDGPALNHIRWKRCEIGGIPFRSKDMGSSYK
jgi:hypothetical protein